MWNVVKEASGKLNHDPLTMFVSQYGSSDEVARRLTDCFLMNFSATNDAQEIYQLMTRIGILRCPPRCSCKVKQTQSRKSNGLRYGSYQAT